MGVHDGHRERLRQMFLESGLTGMSDINALELLLFYAIPRKDTNELAHALLDKFGSLNKVLQATEHELVEVPGIGSSAAGLIMLVPQIMRRGLMSETGKIKIISNSEEAGQYLMPRFMYEQDEIFIILCLNSQKGILKCAELSRGVVNAVDVNVRRVVETALKCRASSVIIAHNHPDSIALPSTDDKLTTRMICKALDSVNIHLTDHLIFAGDEFVSFADSCFMPMLGY